MRVLLLNAFPPPKGGAEAHVADLEALLLDSGHEVDAIAPGAASAVWQRARQRFHNGDIARRVAEQIAQCRPDVLHIHNFLSTLSTAPFRVADRLGVPIVWTAHDYQLFCPRTWAIRADGFPCEQPELGRCLLGNCRGSLQGIGGRVVYALNTVRCRRAGRVVARYATQLIAPASALGQRIETLLRRRVNVVPYPYPTTGQPSESPRHGLLFAGRLAAEKGLPAVFDALTNVPDLTLTIAGDGPERDRWTAMSRRLDLESRVTWRGWMTRDELRASMQRHRALVVPSLWMDNSPVTIYEALAAGLPVLGADRGGIRELIGPQAGFVFEPLSRASTADALRRIAGLSDAAWVAMSRAATERAHAGRAEVFLERILAVYGRATAGERS